MMDTLLDANNRVHQFNNIKLSLRYILLLNGSSVFRQKVHNDDVLIPFLVDSELNTVAVEYIL